MKIKRDDKCPVYDFCLRRRTIIACGSATEMHLRNDYCPYRKELQDRINQTGRYIAR